MAAKRRPVRRGKPGGALYFLYAVCLILGLVLGAILFRHSTKNDGFGLIGEQIVSVAVGSEPVYTDPGAFVTRFGIDFSDRISIQTNLTRSGNGYAIDTSEPGSYYIAYTADVWGFDGVKLIRTIRVEDGKMGEER